MLDTRLIAVDLDGTLLNSDKQLGPADEAALQRAAERGIEIVPATGRFYGGMPQVIRNLPYIRYAVTVNGAQVYDVKHGLSLAKAEIPLERAAAIMEYLDTLPVIYDCYMDDRGWMAGSMQRQAERYTSDPHYVRMIRELRQPVHNLRDYILGVGHDVQKIQLFTADRELRARLLKTLEERFSGLAVSSSLADNVEINSRDANKGDALLRLADALGIPAAATMAFGDGLNDLSMIKKAGVGVAVQNAHEDVKAAADYITASCDDNGVAAAIERLCL